MYAAMSSAILYFCALLLVVADAGAAQFCMSKPQAYPQATRQQLDEIGNLGPLLRSVRFNARYLTVVPCCAGRKEWEETTARNSPKTLAFSQREMSLRQEIEELRLKLQQKNERKDKTKKEDSKKKDSKKKDSNSLADQPGYGFCLTFHAGQGQFACPNSSSGSCGPHNRDTHLMEYVHVGKPKDVSRILSGHMAHNLAIASMNGTYLALGGRTTLHFPTRPWSYLLQSKSWDLGTLSVDDKQRFLSAFHPGCVERRSDVLLPGRPKLFDDKRNATMCEYDGRFTVAPYGKQSGRFRIFTRANMFPRGGGRHVTTADCSVPSLGGCKDMQLLTFTGYQIASQNNIYFFCANWDPTSKTFVGVAPVVHNGKAFVGLTWSDDGVHWSAFTTIYASTADTSGHRSVDQPACGILRNGQELNVLIQTNVPGMWAPGHNCCRPMPAWSTKMVRVKDLGLSTARVRVDAAARFEVVGRSGPG